jgi:hypothetical protein
MSVEWISKADQSIQLEASIPVIGRLGGRPPYVTCLFPPNAPRAPNSDPTVNISTCGVVIPELYAAGWAYLE